MFVIKWDEPILVRAAHSPTRRAIEFRASRKTQKTVTSIAARRQLERIIPLLAEHMMDPTSEPLPARFDIFNERDRVIYQFKVICQTRRRDDVNQTRPARVVVTAVECQ
ncbi:hypothetical protein B9479_004610 [Cryptococcus floricola]|uniref:Uncharacterized protein n=2 Tax=Cryptococcus TaxID=5206 RepID=A0A5D3AV73_9TREE|nr:hypothetical protein B9479_004610 [Cryptococcus floricola]